MSSATTDHGLPSVSGAAARGVSTGSAGGSRTASTSADAQSELNQLSDDMFDKVATYVAGQLEGTVDDYKLLEKMNDTTSQRYSDMIEVTGNVSERLQALNEKYDTLKPYLDQIDEIDRSSMKLEEAAYCLDAYVKSLEGKFKKLDKSVTPS